MSNPKHTTVLGRYNFSRRVVDHRQVYDLNYAINSPIFSKTWLGSAKQRFAGSLMYYFGAYISGSVILFGAGMAFTDAYVQSKLSNGEQQSQLMSPNLRYGENFILNRGNKVTDLGRWNHNFACYENQKNCGRDFDWVYKNPNIENKQE